MAFPWKALASDADLVWGSPSYVDTFLQHTLAQLDLRLQALNRFLTVMGPTTIAAHASLHVLRTNLLPRFVHLFRFLPIDRSLQLAREVDARVLAWLQDSLDLPLTSPPVRLILQTPTAHGGLSLLRLHHEALLHCISGLLALPVEGVPLRLWMMLSPLARICIGSIMPRLHVMALLLASLFLMAPLFCPSLARPPGHSYTLMLFTSSIVPSSLLLAHLMPLLPLRGASSFPPSLRSLLPPLATASRHGPGAWPSLVSHADAL